MELGAGQCHPPAPHSPSSSLLPSGPTAASLVRLANCGRWDELLAMLNRGEGGVNERGQVRHPPSPTEFASPSTPQRPGRSRRGGRRRWEGGEGEGGWGGRNYLLSAPCRLPHFCPAQHLLRAIGARAPYGICRARALPHRIAAGRTLPSCLICAHSDCSTPLHAFSPHHPSAHTEPSHTISTHSANASPLRTPPLRTLGSDPSAHTRSERSAATLSSLASYGCTQPLGPICTPCALTPHEPAFGSRPPCAHTLPLRCFGTNSALDSRLRTLESWYPSVRPLRTH